MTIKEYISKTTKECIKRIYIEGSKLLDTKFKVGSKFSYSINFTNKTIKIVPFEDIHLDGKGKVSRKKRKDSIVPVLDIDNQQILKAFYGCKECKITILEDEILVEGLFDSLSDKETAELVAFLEDHKVIDLVKRKGSFAIKKKQSFSYMKKASGDSNQLDFWNFDYSEVIQSESTSLNTTSVQVQLETEKSHILSVLSLFSGIGAFEQALKMARIPFNLVNYCEVESDIARAYSLINNIPEDKNLGDIRNVDETKLADFDLMTYGFPCQDLSSLGLQKGFENEDGSTTRSGLFFEAMRIAKYKKPSYMIAENVRALLSSKFVKEFGVMLNMLTGMGYNTYYRILNSKDYGLPHSRNRIFIVSIKEDCDDGRFVFPEPEPLTVSAVKQKETGVEDRNLYFGEHQAHCYNEMRLKKKYSSLDADVLICMNTKQGEHSSPQNFFTDVHGVRMLTAREMFKFQGFKEKFGDLLVKNGFSMNRIGYMLGNTISINPIVGILKNLFSKYVLPEKVTVI